LKYTRDCNRDQEMYHRPKCFQETCTKLSQDRNEIHEKQHKRLYVFISSSRTVLQ